MRLIHLIAITALALLSVAGVALAKIDSGNMAAGATFEHTFDDEGTWTYFCAYHAATMTGSVVIEDGAASEPVEIGMTTDTETGAWYFTHDGNATSDLTVTIAPGTTVTWVNDDPTGAAHTVTEESADFKTEEGSGVGFIAIVLAGLALVALRRRQ